MTSEAPLFVSTWKMWLCILAGVSVIVCVAWRMADKYFESKSHDKNNQRSG